MLNLKNYFFITCGYLLSLCPQASATLVDEGISFMEEMKDSFSNS